MVVSLPELCAAKNIGGLAVVFYDGSEAVKQGRVFTMRRRTAQMTASCEHICSLFTRVGIFREPDRHINLAQLNFTVATAVFLLRA